MPPDIFFTGADIDRADALRGDAAAVTALSRSLTARLLLLDGLDPVVGADGGLAWGSMADAPDDAELALLGMVDGRAHFAPLLPAGRLLDPRSRRAWGIIPMLSPGDAALYGMARSMVDWHQRHRFCAACGGETSPARSGWQRDCTLCKTPQFPRTDPVVIMLATFEGKALLGRQAGFPHGRYSALAGFLEPGESIEEAVRRELAEEAGVVAGRVDYVASQPWPFPSQLMIGCLAEAKSDAITLDTQELESAIWVTKAEVQAAIAGDESRFGMPPPFAIAHSLLRYWSELPD